MQPGFHSPQTAASLEQHLQPMSAANAGTTGNSLFVVRTTFFSSHLHRFFTYLVHKLSCKYKLVFLIRLKFCSMEQNEISVSRKNYLVTKEGLGSTLTNEAFEVLSNVDRER